MIVVDLVRRALLSPRILSCPVAISRINKRGCTLSSDRGWGGHHFIAGGSVKGGKLYGDLPEYDLGAQMYTRSRGRLIPTTSVEQYAATLGRWLGLSEADLKTVFPNLDNFSEPFLDFV